MNILIKIIIVTFLLFSCSTRNKEEAINKTVTSFYQENKEKSFQLFNNWTIGIRKGEQELYILDFNENREKVTDRFIIRRNQDSLYIKRIFPNIARTFHLLKKKDTLSNDYPFTDLFFSNLIQRFISLKANKVKDIGNESLLIEKDVVSIIYSESNIEDPRETLNLQGYVKFNVHLWYYVNK